MTPKTVGLSRLGTIFGGNFTQRHVKFGSQGVSEVHLHSKKITVFKPSLAVEKTRPHRVSYLRIFLQVCPVDHGGAGYDFLEFFCAKHVIDWIVYYAVESLFKLFELAPRRFVEHVVYVGFYVLLPIFESDRDVLAS